MTATKNTDLIELVLVLAQECPGRVRASEIERFLKLARQHGRLAEWDCNVGLDARQERAKGRLEREMTTLAVTLWGLKGIMFDGDPRGYTVKLLLPSGKHNTWGGAEDGYGVPQ